MENCSENCKTCQLTRYGLLCGVNPDNCWPNFDENISIVETLIISREISANELSTVELVQRVKAQHPNLSAGEAYGRFVTARDLRPEISMREFKPIFDGVGGNLHRKTRQVNFFPTHVDTLMNKLIQVVPRDGYSELTWENGLTGKEPGVLPERYIPINLRRAGRA